MQGAVSRMMILPPAVPLQPLHFTGTTACPRALENLRLAKATDDNIGHWDSRTEGYRRLCRYIGPSHHSHRGCHSALDPWGRARNHVGCGWNKRALRHNHANSVARPIARFDKPALPNVERRWGSKRYLNPEPHRSGFERKPTLPQARPQENQSSQPCRACRRMSKVVTFSDPP